MRKSTVLRLSINYEVLNKQKWKQGPRYCWLFSFAISKTAMVGAPLHSSKVFRDLNKFKEMQVDTDRLHRVFAEEKPTDCIRSELKKKWEKLRSQDCDNRVTSDASETFFSRPCCTKQENPNKNMLGSSKKNPYARKCCVVVKTVITATTLSLITQNSAAKISIGEYYGREGLYHWKIVENFLMIL